MPALVAVGIDCSDDHHDIYAEAGGAPPLRLRITNDVAGILELLTQLQQAFGNREWHFAVENPALLLSRHLVHAGHSVYAVNPRSVARMREALASSGKKDDRLDAEALCYLLQRRQEDLTAVRLGSATGQLVRGLVQQRVDLVEIKNRHLNQLTAVLKRYFPRALELFNKLEQPLTLEFLRTFDGPTTLSQATREQWNALFANQRYPRPQRVETLWERAQKPQVQLSAVDEELGKRDMHRQLRFLEVALAELAELEAAIATAFADLPDAPIFRSLPGAADVLAPALFALFGDDRKRWQSWEELARLSGTVPITRSSGRSRDVQMRRHCDRRARRILHLFAGCSRRSCQWADDFYRGQRKKGKTNAAALRDLATKWLRILFRMWRNDEPYDEEKYLKNRTQRHQPRTAAPA